MLDKLVRPADTDHRRGDAAVAQMIAHVAAVAALDHVILNGDDHVRRLCEKLGGATVNRLSETRIDNRGIDVFRAEFLDGLFGDATHRAKWEERHFRFAAVGEILPHLGLPNFYQRRLFLHRYALSAAARVADEGRLVLMGCSEHHIGQLVLVAGRHRDDAGHAAQIRDVEQPVMCRPVVGRESGTVHAERNRKVLQRDVVDDHVVSALQEG